MKRAFILRSAERKCDYVGDLQWVKIYYKIEFVGVYYCHFKNCYSIS